MTILAEYAGQRLRRLAIAWQALTAPYSAKDTSGPVIPTEPTQRPAGGAQTSVDALIHRRAVRTRNRNAKAAARFVQVHQTLRER